MRLVLTILCAIAPALGLMFQTGELWLGLLAGGLALLTATISSGEFVVRPIRRLLAATERLAQGDLAVRTGLNDEPGELGELAASIDRTAEALGQYVRELDEADQTLLNRAHQQTVVAALGQFALATDDLDELLHHAVLFTAQTLGVEYAGIFELHPEGNTLRLRSGYGWRPDAAHSATMLADSGSLVGWAFISGEPVRVDDFRTEARFAAPALLAEHGVISSLHVVIAGEPFPFGLLGAHTTNPRVFTEDEVHFLLAVATVIAMAVERRRAGAQLEKLAAFAEKNPNPVLELTDGGQVTYCNAAAQQMALELGCERPDHMLPPGLMLIARDCLESGTNRLRLETHPGNRVLAWSLFPIPSAGVVHCYVEDVTERMSLEAQLRQAQKMESVGQLAAGVAHDFNNMLTIVQGHAGVILARPEIPPAVAESVRAIQFATERAAGLTRQLLMFSRKNVMQRRVLDVCELVGNMTQMLQHLLGETIQLVFRAGPDVPPVEADAGMLEQVVMNLAVNARDAMTRAGTLTISVYSQEITAAELGEHPHGRVGRFVCLRVHDTGCGMDEATLGRIFEPFFTTKEVGKGTGLGLATVYGIVKQHAGWIEVASQVNVGTTFRIYLPAVDKPLPRERVELPASSRATGGHETILLVEDEPILRELAELILREAGYRIVSAGSRVEALRVWEYHCERVDLLLTDMVMPEGMSGKELAQRLRARRPDLKIIYASGYSVDEIDLREAVFIQKPYDRDSLIRAVRQALDGALPGEGQPVPAPAAANQSQTLVTA